MIKFSITKVAFKKAEFTKTLDEACATQVRQAARAFLRAAVEKVPNYTGMARGSLQPLGRLLNVAVDAQFTSRAKKHGHKSRISQGNALGQNAFNFVNTKGSHTFEFSIPDFHYAINEFFNVQATWGIPLTYPTPWDSMGAGLDAFNQYLKDNLSKRIPKIKDYTTRITSELT